MDEFVFGVKNPPKKLKLLFEAGEATELCNSPAATWTTVGEVGGIIISPFAVLIGVMFVGFNIVALLVPIGLVGEIPVGTTEICCSAGDGAKWFLEDLVVICECECECDPEEVGGGSIPCLLLLGGERRRAASSSSEISLNSVCVSVFFYNKIVTIYDIRINAEYFFFSRCCFWLVLLSILILVLLLWVLVLSISGAWQIDLVAATGVVVGVVLCVLLALALALALVLVLVLILVLLLMFLVIARHCVIHWLRSTWRLSMAWKCTVLCLCMRVWLLSGVFHVILLI